MRENIFFANLSNHFDYFVQAKKAINELIINNIRIEEIQFETDENTLRINLNPIYSNSIPFVFIFWKSPKNRFSIIMDGHEISDNYFKNQNEFIIEINWISTLLKSSIVKYEYFDRKKRVVKIKYQYPSFKNSKDSVQEEIIRKKPISFAYNLSEKIQFFNPWIKNEIH